MTVKRNYEQALRIGTSFKNSLNVALSNPHSAFYNLRRVDTAGSKRLSFGNIWVHFKSNYISDDKKQNYLSTNLIKLNDRGVDEPREKVNFISGMSFAKLINPFRHLYNVIFLAAIGIAKGIDTMVPSKNIYDKNGKFVGKRIQSNTMPALVAKTILLAPLALTQTLVGTIASIDKTPEQPIPKKPDEEAMRKLNAVRLTRFVKKQSLKQIKLERSNTKKMNNQFKKANHHSPRLFQRPLRANHKPLEKSNTVKFTK